MLSPTNLSGCASFVFPLQSTGAFRHKAAHVEILEPFGQRKWRPLRVSVRNLVGHNPGLEAFVRICRSQFILRYLEDCRGDGLEDHVFWVEVSGKQLTIKRPRDPLHSRNLPYL